MALQVVDLFCGAGGLSLGFQAAGCRILAATDIDENAGKTFRRNLSLLQRAEPPQVHAGPEFDLRKIELQRISASPPDILIGGPPCQGFSRIGRGKLDSLNEEGFEGDPRNQLYERYLDAVRLWQPKALVMENVPGMLSVKGVNYARIIMEELAFEGYRVGYAHLNAVWYGVPQYRERLFFIGIRKDLGVCPAAPIASHVAELPQGYRRPVTDHTPCLPLGDDWDDLEHELPVRFTTSPLPATTVSDALDDLPAVTEHLTSGGILRGNFRVERRYRSEPHSAFARLMRAWPGFPEIDLIDDHVVRRTPRDHETFRLMKHGDRYPDAVSIAADRFSEELGRARQQGVAPAPGTPDYERLRAEYIPPYPLGSFEDRWRKLYPDQPSWTVVAHLGRDSYSHIHHDSQQARSISVREAARLQSFPDGFRFAGNMGDCFRQIGNAVPPLLSRAIALAILPLAGFAPSILEAS